MVDTLYYCCDDLKLVLRYFSSCHVHDEAMIYLTVDGRPKVTDCILHLQSEMKPFHEDEMVRCDSWKITVNRELFGDVLTVLARVCARRD